MWAARIALVLYASSLNAQDPPHFDVVSVKQSSHTVGKDANRQLVIGAAGVSGANVTLKHLIGRAYQVQPYQVEGPPWLDLAEYDVEAKSDGPVSPDRIPVMLRTLLKDRFALSVHPDTRELRVYELVVDKGGPKIHPVPDASTSGTMAGGVRKFHGSLQQFANLLSLQLTIPVLDDPSKPGIASGTPTPVLDRTGLPGIFDINMDLKLEPGADMFTLWQRLLQSQLGLKLESRKTGIDVIAVDHAERTPTSN